MPPRYPDLAARFQNNIQSGTWSPGFVLPSERHLADAFHVHRSVVSRTLHALVAQHVLHRHGRKLVVPHTPAPPPLASLHAINFTPEMEEGAQRALARAAAPCRFHHCNQADIRSLLLDLLGRGGSGLMLRDLGGMPFDDLAAEFETARGPVVVFGSPHAAFPSVWESAELGLRALCDRLAALGHKQLGWVHPRTILGGIAQRRDVLLPLWTARQGSWSSLALPQHVDPTPLIQTWLQRAAVSAVLCDGAAVSEATLQAASRLGLRVPDDLSVVSLWEMPSDRFADPPVAGLAGAPLEHAGRITAELLLDLLFERATRIRPIPPLQIVLSPLFNDRPSLGRAPDARAPASSQTRSTRPHDRAVQAASDRWMTFDLQPFATRDLHRYHGWLGRHPLLHFPPGPKRVAGVPFQTGSRAIVLRSIRNSKSSISRLPDRIRIPVNASLEAVYFLHACGWSMPDEIFAGYTFRLASGAEVSNPLRTPDRADPGATEPANDANISDWWPIYPQIETPQARPHLVSGDGAARAYQRTLYTFEWIHPDPADLIEWVDIWSVPTRSSTLGLLAIAGLRARSAT